MSIVFGLGIENETLYSFTDKKRKKRDMNVNTSSQKFNSRGASYRSNASYWGRTSGWSRNSNSDSELLLSGDPTVSGNPRASGFEFQTTLSYSIGKKPKELLDGIQTALNQAVKEIENSDEYPYANPNPFGSTIGFSKKRCGSFHINITMPYHSERMDDDVYANKWKEKVFRGIKVVRAIEPLFFAMIGGADFLAVGNPSYPDGSSRQVWDGYGNIGNSDLNQTYRDAIFGMGQIYHGFKHDGTNAKFKRMISNTLDYDNMSPPTTDVADIMPKYYRNTHLKARTIEFRFLDQFFALNLYEIMKVIVSAMEHGDNVGSISDSKLADSWNEATAVILEEGWNARIPKSYIELLNSKLGLSLTVTDKMRADMVFQEVAKQLWKKNKNGFWVKTLFDEYEEPKVLNLNKSNWDMQFRHKYLNNERFEKFIDKFLSILCKIDASKSNGWIKVNFKSLNSGDGTTVRDLLLDGENIGIDLAVEDYEEIMFLLERIDAVELKINESGQIDKVKVKMDFKEIVNAIHNMNTIEGIDEVYFRTRSRLSEEPEPTPEPTPTPQRQTRVTTSTESSIDMERLRIMSVDVPEELDLDREDLEIVFNNANFIDNGANYRIRVKFANIFYNSRSISAFWVKNGRAVTIHLDPVKFNLGSVSAMVRKMKEGFYSPISIEQNNIFVRNITYDDFFNRLLNIAEREYDKGNNVIKLDSAGMNSLRSKGIRIASLNRGERYFIVNNKKYNLLKRKYKNLKLVNYIPYQRQVYVKKRNNVYDLMMNGKKIDSIR